MTIRRNEITIKINNNSTTPTMTIRKENITEFCEGLSFFPVKLEIEKHNGNETIRYNHLKSEEYNSLHDMFFSEEEDEMISEIINDILW